MREPTVVLHHDDHPESDITVVHGLRCTTAVRTVIDIAAELRCDELETVMDDGLDRGLFTIDEMPRGWRSRTLTDGRVPDPSGVHRRTSPPTRLT